ncbi:MAG: DUF4905 domain-containing protein [Bacteroidota bacterium]
MPKKLRSAFSFSFQASVWKTVVDAAGTRLFLELRRAEDKQPYFAAVDLTSGELLWKDFTLTTPSGWVTLHGANDKYLVLQAFTDTHNPEKKSYYLVEIATQEVTQSADYSSIASSQVDTEKSAEKQNNGIWQPFFYAEDQLYFTTVANFTTSLGLDKPVGGCEYLEYRNYIGIAYYVPTEHKGELANYLLIIDQAGEILLHPCLEKSVPQPGLGTFFVVQNQLIVVENKTRLVSYVLP